MTLWDSSRWRSELMRSWSVPAFTQFNARVHALSSGDRVVFYVLVVLFGIASLSGLYALEQSLLVVIPGYGGSLVEGTVGSPRFINPLLGISDADRDLSLLTYAGLMGLSGSGTLVPVLAESYTVSEDGKIYTFVLRENATFSDGSLVTPADVVFTIQKAQDATLKSPEYANWSGVSVEAIDGRTVRFTLGKPYAPFLGLTTLGILPSRLWQTISTAEFPFSGLQTQPVGAGPFKVTGIAHNTSGLIRSITLSANPHYALGRPYLDTIRFDFYARAEDLSNAHANGSVESAYGLPASEPLQSLSAPYARVFGVFWNPNEKQVYTREEVRKALSLALNRKTIITEVLGGYATAIIGPVPPGGSVTQTSVPESPDPTAAAAEILQEAGWKYDGSKHVWEQASAEQTLESITIRTSNVPELKNVASAVKADWERLGIPVDIELYEPGDLSQNVIRPRKYEALLYGMVIGRDQDLYAFWDSRERNDPGLNIALYANKTVDTLIEGARSSVDEATRASNLQKIEDLISAEYPAAFMYAPDFTYTIPADLKGVLLPQIVTPTDRFATVALWYRNIDAVWPFFAPSSRQVSP